MQFIASLVDQCPSASTDATVTEIDGRFQAAPDAQAFAVCADGRVLGVIERDAVEKAMWAGYAQSPIGALMRPDPLIADARTPCKEVCRALLADGDPRRSAYVVVQNGVYFGMATLAGLVDRLLDERSAREVAAEHVRAELAPVPPATAAAQADPVPGTAHVLVVDDNATNRKVAEALCEMFNCTSECAEDGFAAVEAARSGRFDLILMDIKMPRMDGIAAAKAIRDLDGPLGQTPIVALTANVDLEDAGVYLAAGMCCVVEKPIKPDRLHQAIHIALEARPAGLERVKAA
jgi:CheY-like chemotaxis protein